MDEILSCTFIYICYDRIYYPFIWMCKASWPAQANDTLSDKAIIDGKKLPEHKRLKPIVKKHMAQRMPALQFIE